MNKKFVTILVFVGVIIAVVIFVAYLRQSTSPAVKKSDTGICHEKGTYYYGKTKNFVAYLSVADCLASGGRAPKK